MLLFIYGFMLTRFMTAPIELCRCEASREHLKSKLDALSADPQLHSIQTKEYLDKKAHLLESWSQHEDARHESPVESQPSLSRFSKVSRMLKNAMTYAAVAAGATAAPSSNKNQDSRLKVAGDADFLSLAKSKLAQGSDEAREIIQVACRRLTTHASSIAESTAQVIEDLDRGAFQHRLLYDMQSERNSLQAESRKQFLLAISQVFVRDPDR